jgi:hypothetical protein
MPRSPRLHLPRRLRRLWIMQPGLPPALMGDLDGVHAGGLPPRQLIAGTMHRAMVRATERDGEFIAGFAAQCPRLQIAKVMRVGLFAAAKEAGLSGHKAKMLAVAIAPGPGECEDALVDTVGLIEIATFNRGRLLQSQCPR